MPRSCSTLLPLTGSPGWQSLAYSRSDAQCTPDTLFAKHHQSVGWHAWAFSVSIVTRVIKVPTLKMQPRIRRPCPAALALWATLQFGWPLSSRHHGFRCVCLGGDLRKLTSSLLL